MKYIRKVARTIAASFQVVFNWLQVQKPFELPTCQLAGTVLRLGGFFFRARSRTILTKRIIYYFFVPAEFIRVFVLRNVYSFFIKEPKRTIIIYTKNIVYYYYYYCTSNITNIASTDGAFYYVRGVVNSTRHGFVRRGNRNRCISCTILDQDESTRSNGKQSTKLDSKNKFRVC